MELHISPMNFIMNCQDLWKRAVVYDSVND